MDCLGCRGELPRSHRRAGTHISQGPEALARPSLSGHCPELREAFLHPLIQVDVWLMPGPSACTGTPPEVHPTPKAQVASAAAHAPTFSSVQPCSPQLFPPLLMHHSQEHPTGQLSEPQSLSRGLDLRTHQSGLGLMPLHLLLDFISKYKVLGPERALLIVPRLPEEAAAIPPASRHLLPFRAHSHHHLCYFSRALGCRQSIRKTSPGLVG